MPPSRIFHHTYMPPRICHHYVYATTTYMPPLRIFHHTYIPPRICHHHVYATTTYIPPHIYTTTYIPPRICRHHVYATTTYNPPRIYFHDLSFISDLLTTLGLCARNSGPCMAWPKCTKMYAGYFTPPWLLPNEIKKIKIKREDVVLSNKSIEQWA